MPAVPASPALVLLTGANFLKRSVNDAIFQINGFDELSVVVVVDPEVIYTAGQDGVLIAKHRADNDQRQWRLIYTASTGLVTVELYDAPGAGANLCSRVSSVAITTRAVVAFTYDGTSLNLYVNGALANGALTGAVPAVLQLNTEPISVGAEATSGSPVNVWRGAVFAVGVWNIALTGVEVATITRDGTFPTALKDISKAPQLIFEHTAIVQASTSRLFSQWTDSAGNARHLTGDATSGAVPIAQQAVGGLLVFSNRWGDALTDIGDLALGQGLTSTYVSAPPFRTWNTGLSAPNRAAWRDGKHDVTVFIRARRVAGTTDTLFFQAFGLELRYQLSSKEMYAIVGADSSNTLQNKKISFGTNLFAVEGITADLVLRYNVVTDEVDLFIGSTQFGKTITTTNSFFNGSGLTLSDRADFSQAIVVPMCLSDAQVAQLQATVQQTVYSLLPVSQAIPGGPLFPQYTPDIPAVATPPSAVASDDFPMQGANLATGVRSIPPPSLMPDPYAMSEVPTNAYDDPLPEVVRVVANGSHIITAVGRAGQTNAYFTAHWWEVELEPGLAQVVAVTTPAVGIFFFSGRNLDTRNFPVPVGQNWNGKKIRMVVQAVADSAQVWKSDWVTMSGANFNNSSFLLPNYDNPAPEVVSVVPDDQWNVLLTGKIGPVTADILSAPGIVYWWEFEATPGVFYAIARETILSAVPSQATVVDTFQIPSGINLNRRNLRLAARSLYDYGEVWKSAPVFLDDDRFDRSDFKVKPLPPGPPLGEPLREVLPQSGPGVLQRRNYDFSRGRV